MPSSGKPQGNRHSTFTLIELLVLIFLVSTLFAAAIPALQNTRNLAKNTLCVNNLKNIGTASHLYTQNHNKYWPAQSVYAPALRQLRKDAGMISASDWASWQDHLADEYLSADPLDNAVPTYQCPFDSAERPNNPFSSYTANKYGIRDKSRFSYARIFPHSAEAGVLSGLPSGFPEDELGSALYTWPYRFGTLRCVTGSNGVECLYNCERGADIRSASNARFLVENHRGVAQSRIGITAHVNRNTWWQAPSSGSGGHATFHRSGRVQYSMNTLAFDLHVNNIPPSAQPHTAFLITRRPPGCRNSNGIFDGYQPVIVGK